MINKVAEVRTVADNLDNLENRRQNYEKQSVQAIFLGYTLAWAVGLYVAQIYMGDAASTALGSLFVSSLMVGWGVYHKKKENLPLIRCGLLLCVIGVGLFSELFLFHQTSFNWEAAGISWISATSVALIFYGLIIRKWPISE